MREWLPRLVGIERGLGVGRSEGRWCASVPEAAHAAALVRDTVTPAVHYLRFGFTPAQVEAFGGAGEVPWWPATPPTRPGPFCRRKSAASCSVTCSAQQSRFLSADQGEFFVWVFTGPPA
jgi:hypothetical protein